MGVEIEVKHLVADEGWRLVATDPVRMAQGYVAAAEDRTVRVRIGGDRAWLTLKFGTGMSRAEFEYVIPADDARELLDQAVGTVLDKTRWHVAHAGRTWEVDEFHGALEGLVLAELELDAEDDDFDLPPWIGEDVTGRPEYLNSSLSTRGMPR
ncbi:CYTH domain-containing protein [Demequina lignilytica]|uniref:CYTH domain-containing protein n=1 Tax=Demequina lignilytica TaxID=3051663 RepID=A0AAW7LZR4_9MICO|nr:MULTISPECIES: CYTH domain-containing protein [unclassified Demequina]MDN4482090.1 CYTH domain-containing protein [Demequina sp. SYSU T0a273]MDN4486748.1 CYTH domain-containing protein [Demequina sp. SYSU T00039]MDN4489432.1 CYTH domain-containing protein [Demequina sp. SYSU T00068]